MSEPDMGEIARAFADQPWMRAIALSTFPQGRQVLETEAELEKVRITARAIGLAEVRADEAVYEVVQEVITRPEFVSINEICRRATLKLCEGSLWPLRQAREN